MALIGVACLVDVAAPAVPPCIRRIDAVAREEAQRQLATAVDWGRYAELFEYDSVNQVIELTESREDVSSGRRTTTVYYANGTRTVAYTIVSGGALHTPSHARTVRREGVEFRTFADGGRTVVTWQRRGHTCVLSASGVPSSELLTLADWRGKGAVPF